MGKLIYEPAGRAHEFSPYACNLFKGCSNRCEYLQSSGGALKTPGSRYSNPKEGCKLKGIQEGVANVQSRHHCFWQGAVLLVR